MRLACLAGLIAATWAAAAAAFEIEDRALFPPANPDGTVLSVISTADLGVFAPLIEDFQARYPDIGVDYIVASSAELAEAVSSDGARFDLAISSAMDLQLKLANDGHAQAYRSAATDAIPAWAAWRGQVFAFTREPAVLVLSREHFDGLPLPRTRQELVTILRENPDRFRGRLGTYDIRDSGLGYLFATQDARNSDAYWRLSEVMGQLDARLYCCSGEMIDDVASGRLGLAYNVLGSYAAVRAPVEPGIRVVTLEDYANVMLRTVLMPAAAPNPRAAGVLLDYLLRSGNDRDFAGPRVLPPLSDDRVPTDAAFGPIRLGPALLVYLDRLNRVEFLRAWTSAMEQG